MQTKDIHQLFLNSTGVCTDTRKIKKNQIYFALKGDHFDGNKFALKALEQGASYAVVDHPELANKEHCIYVDNVLASLQELANYHRRYINIPIIAITGSNGKTTTKKLINELLQQKFKTKATAGNFNNHIGVPLTLLSFDHSIDYGIVEMGANHQKEIEFLCQIAMPNYGVITNFGKAHLEGFGGVEGVIKGKSELYQFLSKTKGTAFVLADDSKQIELTKNMSRVTIGSKPTNNYTIEAIKTFPKIEFKFKNQQLSTPLNGEYNFNNISIAVGIASYFGVELEAIKEALKNFEPEENRSQFIQKNSHQILLDAYNANPSSMEASIKNFSQHQNEKTLILGDMFEIGDEALMEHFNIYKLCKQENFKKVFFCGQLFYEALKNTELPKGFQAFQEYEDLAQEIQRHFSENQLILIKGSRGMKLERVLDLL